MTRGWALGAVVTVLCFTPAIAHKKDPAPQASERQRAIQALNRLTFGACPGDVDRIISMGVDKWIDQQLHPEAINDDALEARLAPFRTLRMSPRELAENFPPPALIRQIADRKESVPRDPRLRAVYEA